MRETTNTYMISVHFSNWPAIPLPPDITQIYLLFPKFTTIYFNLPLECGSKNANTRKNYPKTTQIYICAAPAASDISNV